MPAFAVANAGHYNRFSCPQFDSLAMMVLCNIKLTSFTVLFRHARARGRSWRHTTTSLPSSCSLLLYKARSCALGVAPFPGNNARRRLEPPQSFPSVPHFTRVRARPTSHAPGSRSVHARATRAERRARDSGHKYRPANFGLCGVPVTVAQPVKEGCDDR